MVKFAEEFIEKTPTKKQKQNKTKQKTKNKTKQNKNNKKLT